MIRNGANPPLDVDGGFFFTYARLAFLSLPARGPFFNFFFHSMGSHTGLAHADTQLASKVCLGVHVPGCFGWPARHDPRQRGWTNGPSSCPKPHPNIKAACPA